ncbi:sensor histidine kinase [Sulfurospirillum sp. 1307]
MNKEEKKALIKFLTIYLFSALILVLIIGFLYYKKELVAIEDKCSIEMVNKAMMVEKDLMNSFMEHKKYNFKEDSGNLHVGLFGPNGEEIYSNLKSKNVLLSQNAYRDGEHEYHIHKLNHLMYGIKYIVIEGNQVKSEKLKLILLISAVSFASMIFIGFIGYLLSKMLIAPIKDRVEKLNRFIKDSAHDINTPVSALMMSVSSLRNKEKIDKRVLNHISISAKLISQIYNSLSFLAFNEKDEVLDQEFDLKDSVIESVKFFDEIAKSKDLKIICELESTMVFMDRSRIQKVINNLISNAIKYSYQNTRIDIKLKDRVLMVQDEGVGIAKEDQESIFNRYERKNKESGGFGIGLDIVKTVCKAYNIKIELKSELSKGTTFYLTFP